MKFRVIGLRRGSPEPSICPASARLMATSGRLTAVSRHLVFLTHKGLISYTASALKQVPVRSGHSARPYGMRRIVHIAVLRHSAPTEMDDRGPYV